MNYRPISYPIIVAAVFFMVWAVKIVPHPLTDLTLTLPAVALFIVGFALEMFGFILWMTGLKQSEKPREDYSMYAHDEWADHSSRKPYTPPKNNPDPGPPHVSVRSIPHCAVSRAELLTDIKPMVIAMAQRLELDKVAHDEFLPDRNYVDHRRAQEVVEDYERHIRNTYEMAYGAEDELPNWCTDEVPAFLRFSDAGVQLCPT